MNCLSVFDHFVDFALDKLNITKKKNEGKLFCWKTKLATGHGAVFECTKDTLDVL